MIKALLITHPASAIGSNFQTWSLNKYVMMVSKLYAKHSC